MSLYNEYIKTGNIYFKYRTFIPLIILLPILFYIYLRPDLFFSERINFIFICIFISFSGQFIRILTVGYTPRGTSGRNTQKQIAKQLNTLGIYSIVRHPLYLGNYLMWLGMIIFFNNITVLIIFTIFYYYYYQKIMFAEEAFLIEKFDEKYFSWSANVPSFIPKITGYKKSSYLFNLKTVLIREYSNITGIVLAYVLISFYQYYLTNIQNLIVYNSKYIFIVSLIFFLICRYFKKGIYRII